MAFNLENEIREADASAAEYFLTWNKEIVESKDEWLVIREALGPLNHQWPEWHPMAAICGRDFNDLDERGGIAWLHGCDHTRQMARGFVTCPYEPRPELIDRIHFRTAMVCNGYYDGQPRADGPLRPWFDIIARKVQFHFSYVTRELIDYLARYPNGSNPPVCHDHNEIEDYGGIVRLYAPSAWPVMVWMTAGNQWEEVEFWGDDGMVLPSMAVPLMLARELLDLAFAQRAERWTTMRPYILGAPHGATSSVIVNNDTGKALKRAYVGLMDSGAYGPYKND